MAAGFGLFRWLRTDEDRRHRESLRVAKRQSRYAAWSLAVGAIGLLVAIVGLAAARDTGEAGTPTTVSVAPATTAERSLQVNVSRISTAVTFEPRRVSLRTSSPVDADVAAAGSDDVPTASCPTPNADSSWEDETVLAQASRVVDVMVVEVELAVSPLGESDVVWVFLSPDGGSSWWIRRAGGVGGELSAEFVRPPKKGDPVSWVTRVFVGEAGDFEESPEVALCYSEPDASALHTQAVDGATTSGLALVYLDSSPRSVDNSKISGASAERFILIEPPTPSLVTE